MKYNSRPPGEAGKVTKKDFIELCNAMDATKHLDPDLIEKDMEILFTSKDVSLQNSAAKRINFVGDVFWKHMTNSINQNIVENKYDWYIYLLSNIDICNEVQMNIDILVNKNNPSDLRQKACYTVVDGGVFFCEDLLIETLNDDDANVRASAAEALGELGKSAKKSVQPLMKIVLSNECSWKDPVKDNAGRSISMIGGPEILEKLLHLDIPEWLKEEIEWNLKIDCGL